jgi:anti-sigma-K factor RskA
MGLEIAKNKFQAMQNRNRPSKEKNWTLTNFWRT